MKFQICTLDREVLLNKDKCQQKYQRKLLLIYIHFHLWRWAAEHMPHCRSHFKNYQQTSKLCTIHFHDTALFQPNARRHSPPELCTMRAGSLYSGLKLTSWGRSVDWSILMSFAVTLHDSSISDFKCLSDFRWRKPALVTREFDMFKETSWVSPAVKNWFRQYPVFATSYTSFALISCLLFEILMSSRPKDDNE